MVQGKKLLLSSLLVAASSFTLENVSHAATALPTFTETGDAGQTLATAEVVPAADTLIDGTIATGNPSDADLYKISLTSSSTYTFSTVNAYTDAGGVDTELSLFSSTGTAIFENDDASGTTTDSKITATLAAGTYYIGVSSSGNEAVNSNNQVLFVGLSQSGDTTAQRGPASGVNPTTEFNFNSNNYDTTTTGQYQIGITAAVPEPSTWAAFVLGGIAAGFTILRRRAA